jgi:hypothetical protein
MKAQIINPQQSQPHLMHSALLIVLQYWMIPNLGWSTKWYESKLPLLRNALVEDRLRYASNLGKEQKEQHRTTVMQRYEQEFLYFDNQHLELLKNKLNQETQDRHFHNLQVSRANKPNCKDKEIINVQI